ncbi:carbonic anhydrase [Denitrobaculum tricleocarpae]|uniref:Carbonic anhydrase n=1 Tax=Denitrobaculum tricleocarpae TaxID=2591009 RepID=A0A545TMK7_9PROT|nr:carbonic anhydrase [Denitrobaculum tricleocarpae]TQV78444.1 carbonic anhydrase [Denitrobaculum tricleocarpae]
MRRVSDLVEGYHRFLRGQYPEEAELYRSLAEAGQAPKTMVIACCDSRVDPAAIFNAGPGRLFVVRNVANLVPPFEPSGDHHGTSAAVEYAVLSLEVENILVMGHGRCGGIRAFLDGLHEKPSKHSFIDSWMSLLSPAREEALRDCAGEPIEAQQRALEHASIRNSIENLKTFPFVKERVDDGRLRLMGAFFDIAEGLLMTLNQESGQFEAVDQ